MDCRRHRRWLLVVLGMSTIAVQAQVAPRPQRAGALVNVGRIRNMPPVPPLAEPWPVSSTAADAPVVPSDRQDAHRHVVALLAGLPPTRQIPPDRIVAIGWYGAMLDGSARASIRHQLATWSDGLQVGDANRSDPIASGALTSREGHAQRLRAIWIAEHLVELGPDPGPALLRKKLRGDRCAQFAALQALALNRGAVHALRAELTAAFDPGTDVDGHPIPRQFRQPSTLLDVPVQLLAARWCVISGCRGDDALEFLLDLGRPQDRISALQQLPQRSVSWSLRYRIIRSLRAADEAEVRAALVAISATGIPPRVEWNVDRAAMARTLARGTVMDDESADLRARLTWRGPTDADALPALDVLAADASRPDLAAFATSVAVRIRRQVDGADADRDR